MTPILPPPAATFAIFSLKLQVPRSTRTTLPVSEPAANGRQPSRLPPAPSPYWTGTFVEARSSGVGPALDDGLAGGERRAAVGAETHREPVEDGTAVWATEIAAGAVDGVPTTYGLSPLLPADSDDDRARPRTAFWTAALRSSSGSGP